MMLLPENINNYNISVAAVQNADEGTGKKLNNNMAHTIEPGAINPAVM